MAQETAPTNGSKRSRDALSPPNADLELKRRRLDGGATDGLGNSLGTIASALSGVFGYNRPTPDPSQENIPPSEDGVKPMAQLAAPQAPTPAPEQPPRQAPISGGYPSANNIAPEAPMSTQAPAAAPAAAPAPVRIEIRLPAPSSRPAIKLKALKGTKWDTGDLKPLPKGKAAASKPPPPRKPAAKPRGRKKATTAAASSLENSADIPAAVTGTATATATTTNGRRPATDVADDTSASAPVDTPTKNRLFSPVIGAAPKGILTPTKKRGPRPNKNVTFDAGGGLFDHIPRSASARKPGRPKKLEEPDDGIRCGICAKPHSRPPNEIILCDNCDFAVHQECYGIPEIPEGDWLCKSCTQEDALKVPKAELGLTAAPTLPTAEVPGIPNLEQHLGAQQRMLLGRCAGRRRMRMFGQDEASDKVRQLIEQTVLAGEGNSMLLIGPRGSGKTTVCIIGCSKYIEMTILTAGSLLKIQLPNCLTSTTRISMLLD